MRYTLGRRSSIHMGAFVTGAHIHIGDNVVVNRRVYLDGRMGLTLRNNISISPEAYLVSMEHDPNDPHFGTRGGEIVIEDNVWIGARAMIMPAIHVGEGAVVAAGAVVTKDVEPYQIVGGVPARVIGSRSRDIQYRVEYFPWFDTDIQRDSAPPAAPQRSASPGAPRPVHPRGPGRLGIWMGYPLKALKLARRHGLVAAARAVKDKLNTPPRNLAQEPLNAASLQAWIASYEQAGPRSARSPAQAPSSPPEVSILVLTYNNALLNRICLESIIRNTASPAYEIIVVDNGSTDGTPAWLQQFAAGYPHIRLILNPENRGFSAANNQAAAAASGKYLVFLNNDTVVTPGWLDGLLSHLQADPQIGLVGPVTNATGNEARIPTAYRTPAEMEALAASRATDFAGKRMEMRMLAFFCVMARKAEYDALGGLDERFGVGMFEDEDLAVRYQQRGLRVVCAEDVFIHHFWRASFGQLEQDRYDRLFAENRSKFEEKWGRKWEPYIRRASPDSLPSASKSS
jgi:GT2 family glycosyltransferase/acetyltransferase-like isoleucine patch superfamily enzyme